MPHYGSHWLLANIPLVGVWPLVIFPTVLLGGFLRERVSGIMYNISYASFFGDMLFLPIPIFLAAEILQRNASPIPASISTWEFHATCALLAITAGALLAWVGWNRNDNLDRFHHDLFVVPYITYLLLSTIPVIWCRGSSVEWWGVIGAILCWIVLFAYDCRSGRVDQPQWFMEKWRIDIKPGS